MQCTPTSVVKAARRVAGRFRKGEPSLVCSAAAALLIQLGRGPFDALIDLSQFLRPWSRRDETSSIPSLVTIDNAS